MLHSKRLKLIYQNYKKGHAIYKADVMNAIVKYFDAKQYLDNCKYLNEVFYNGK